MERVNARVRGHEGEPDIASDPRAAHLLTIARLLDSSIEVPGMGIRIGLDPLLGLVPVVGDAVTAMASLYIIYRAKQMGASSRQIRAMLANVAIDFLVGEIPVLGDLFDFAFKANQRNLIILGFPPETFAAPARTGRS